MHHILSESQFEQLIAGGRVELAGGDSIALAAIPYWRLTALVEQAAGRSLARMQPGRRSQRLRQDLDQQDTETEV